MTTIPELAGAVTELATGLDTALTVPDGRDGMTVWQRIRASFNGWPSGSGYDRTARASTDSEGEPLPGHSDPTANAALQDDQAANDERELRRLLEAARRALDAATTIAGRYTLRDASAFAQSQTEGEGSDGCISCARIQGHGGKPYWNPVFRRTKLENGVLVDLCSYCYADSAVSALKTGKLPPIEAVTARRDGKAYRSKVA